MENCDFSLVLLHLKNEGHAKRSIVKNDTVIILYKDRLYHQYVSSGVRYAYVPTNADLQATDWELIFLLDDKIQKLALKNSLKEELMKF